MDYSLPAVEPLFLRARKPPPYVPGPGAKRVAAEIGGRLKEARRAAGMTRDALGRALGIGADTLRRYETGERRIPPVRLAAATVLFGLPLSWFFRERDAAGEDEGD
ncbi:MAG TPA: helix-turn-helix transcriptional regulator [Stellaceae bacterium]|nr:helix-turn-helix transcriptional regulator [Stellaceae bacterium]